MFDWTFKIFSTLSDYQLQLLRKEIADMALNVDALNAAVAALHQDVQNVIRKIETLNLPNAEDQAKVDNITDALNAIDAGLDAIAPDPIVPTPEPTPEQPTE